MKVLLLGAGAVGEAYALLTQRADPDKKWLGKMVIADFSLERAVQVAERLDDEDRYPCIRIDAGNREQIAKAVREYGIDLILNGCPQSFDEPVFDAAYEAGCHYMDMAMSLSQKHPQEPFGKVGVMLGDYQYARHRDWEAKGLLALLAIGIDPGVSDVFAKYADKHLFDDIDEIGIRDGSDMTVQGSKDGKPREVYLYQVSDNEACMREFGCQAVAAQTAVGPAIATELLVTGIWHKNGVLPPEAFDPDPFMERMASYGFPYHMRDSWA